MPAPAKKTTVFNPIDLLTFMVLFMIDGAIDTNEFDSVVNLEIAEKTSVQELYDHYCASEKSEWIERKGYEYRHTYYYAEYEGRMKKHVACFSIHEGSVDVRFAMA
jgi:hypothetical protein